MLERPLRVPTLLSAVRTALRARERQYQIRGHLAERATGRGSRCGVADQRKDEFLATLGHELRNPLAPLLTGLQLLRMAEREDPVARRVARDRWSARSATWSGWSTTCSRCRGSPAA